LPCYLHAVSPVIFSLPSSNYLNIDTLLKKLNQNYRVMAKNYGFL